MGRKRSVDVLDDFPSFAESSSPDDAPPLSQAAAAPAPVVAAPAPFIATAGQGRYQVSLHCPTPLAHKTLIVEAASEDEARQKFCALNGISGSSHEWQITRVS